MVSFNFQNIVQPSPLPDFRTFLSLQKETLCPLSSHSPFPQQLICFLFLWICLFWTFPMEWNPTECGHLCLAVHSSIVLSRFICVAACVALHSLCCQHFMIWLYSLPLSVHLLISIWSVSTCWLLGIMLQTFRYNFCVWTRAPSSLG